MITAGESVDCGRIKALLCVLGSAVFFAACTASVARTEAQAVTGYTWKSYTNVRFQYSVCYPEQIFTPQGESPNSDGQTFVAKDGAKLVVYGQNNALHEDLKEQLQDTAARLSGDSGKVTLKVLKPRWFVVSGENGPNIFYAKTLYSNDQFKSFEITYSSTDSKIYNAIVSKLASCFAETKH